MASIVESTCCLRARDERDRSRESGLTPGLRQPVQSILSGCRSARDRTLGASVKQRPKRDSVRTATRPALGAESVDPLGAALAAYRGTRKAVWRRT